jgi:hypothetical protein
MDGIKKKEGSTVSQVKGDGAEIAVQGTGIVIGVQGTIQAPVPLQVIGVQGNGGPGFPAPGGIPIPSARAIGVQGLTTDSNGFGVDGTNNSSGIGVHGSSNTGIGVNGFSHHIGVFAESDGTGPGCQAKAGNDTMGFLAGSNPLFASERVGAYGESNDIGVFGFAKTAKGTGVVGNSTFGSGIGVHGFTTTGVAVLGSSDGAGPAGRFLGNVEVTGDVRVDGDVFLVNKDLAERFQVSETVEHTAGMLMVIGENGRLVPCSSPYDKRAVGVISGAGALRPAITLGSLESASRTVPIALVGTALCWADADAGAIEAGDLLTTSGTPGHAMKAEDPTKSFGAIVGKALAPLRRGRGLVPMVISLQ